MRIFALIVALCSSAVAFAQSCPYDDARDASAPSKLHGRIKYHNELRQWIGLKLDKPACDESEIQLVLSKDDGYRKAKSLRGCAATITGTLFIPEPGYYSAELATMNPKIQPDASCNPLPLEPYVSKKKIPRALKIYIASIKVDHRGKGQVDWHVEDPSPGGGPLALPEPEPYIAYWLSVSWDSLWIGCADSFKIEAIQLDGNQLAVYEGFPERDGWRMSLPEDGFNTISYTCERQ